MSHDPSSQKTMRSRSRSRNFTYSHYTRNPSYSATTRQRMSEDRETYLEHLGRWLNYEAEFAAAGESYSEADEGGDVIVHPAHG